MNFSKLKEFRINKSFHKRLLNVSKVNDLSKEIKTVGVLSLASISDSLKLESLESEIATILGVKNVKIYSFKTYDKSDKDSFKYFTQKDINWQGNFVEPSFQKFLDQPFDLLIGYFDASNLYLEMAVLQSKASFKVGFSNVNKDLYKLEISEKAKNLNTFLSELKKYLKILKKLKN